MYDLKFKILGWPLIAGGVPILVLGTGLSNNLPSPNFYTFPPFHFYTSTFTRSLPRLQRCLPRLQRIRVNLIKRNI